MLEASMSIPNPRPMPDPLIEEVHEFKLAASARSGHHLGRLSRRFAEIEPRHRGIVAPPPKDQPCPPGRAA